MCGGREVERNEWYTQGDISHVIAGAHLIVNKVKGGKNKWRKAKAQVIQSWQSHK
jgi:hypothetical protein